MYFISKFNYKEVDLLLEMYQTLKNRIKNKKAA